MLTACAARVVVVGGELMVGWGLAGVRVWILVGECMEQGPGGGPGERQRGQRVLIGCATGAVIVIQG